MVTFVLDDISEVFQFFDSQNARGRDLEPHDLLKAYHLREFSSDENSLKARTVSDWENTSTDKLATLFAEYLYRIRNWSKGASARYFGKEDTALFKGVNMAMKPDYPFAEQLRISHHFVDNYNQQYERKIDAQVRSFPFHLDKIIINGRRFFEMIAHYQKILDEYKKDFAVDSQSVPSGTLDGSAPKILTTLNSYEGRYRTGDRYVRTMFDCLLIYYMDKFGHAELSRAIEKTFIWAYHLRLSKQAVKLASMDNYVLEHNLFKLIRDAVRPSKFINCTLPMLKKSKSSKTKKIECLFKEMKYYECQN